jgi:hypothetical protein
MNGRMDVLIAYDDVARLWHTGEEPHIGVEPRVEKERGVATEKIDEAGFERGMCFSVHQQPGSTGAQDIRSF